MYLGGEFLFLKGYLDKPLLNATRGDKTEEDGDKIQRKMETKYIETQTGAICSLVKQPGNLLCIFARFQPTTRKVAALVPGALG